METPCSVGPFAQIRERDTNRVYRMRPICLGHHCYVRGCRPGVLVSRFAFPSALPLHPSRGMTFWSGREADHLGLFCSAFVAHTSASRTVQTAVLFSVLPSHTSGRLLTRRSDVTGKVGCIWSFDLTNSTSTNSTSTNLTGSGSPSDDGNDEECDE